MVRHIASWFLLGLLALTTLPTFAAETTDQLLDRFVGELESRKGLSAEARKQVTDLIKILRSDPEGKSLAVTEALRLVDPAYQQALTDLADENLATALPALVKLSGSDDPWLAADAAYFLARGYLIGERFEEAMPLLDQLRTKLADRSSRLSTGRPVVTPTMFPLPSSFQPSPGPASTMSLVSG